VAAGLYGESVMATEICTGGYVLVEGVTSGALPRRRNVPAGTFWAITM
jgi:hypothetical protein